MKILILGGTGAIGKALTPILINRGDKVWCTSRNYHENNGSITYLKGNAHNNAFFQRCMSEKYDVVIDFMIYGTEEFRSRVEILLNNCTQYIFTSSCRVFGSAEEIISEKSVKLLDVCENKKYLRTDEYALAKARQENILKESGKSNWTIIRPYITYNDNRMQLGSFEKEEWLRRAEVNKKIVFPEVFYNKKTTMTSAEDVAYYISELIGNDRTFGEDYNLVSSQAIYWKDILEIYKQTYKEIWKRDLEIQLVKNTIDWGTIGWRDIYDRNYNRVFDNTKIKSMVRSKEDIDVKDGISKCMKSFYENQIDYKKIRWSLEGRLDRVTGDVTNLRDILGMKNRIRYYLFRNISTIEIAKIQARILYNVNCSEKYF